MSSSHQDHEFSASTVGPPSSSRSPDPQPSNLQSPTPAAPWPPQPEPPDTQPGGDTTAAAWQPIPPTPPRGYSQPYPPQPYPPQPYPQQPYPPQQSYVQQPYPQQPPFPAPSYAQQAGVVPGSGYAPQPVWVAPVPIYPYAHWGRRVGAYLIDLAPAILASIPFYVGYVMLYVQFFQAITTARDPSSLDLFTPGPGLWLMIIGLALLLASIGWQWYNRWLTGGRTGQSLGKRVLKIKLVAEVNGQPIGAVNAFLRDLLHVLDGAAYVGYLWPLWDAKRQTFADMIMKTVVIDQPGPPAGDRSQHSAVS
jgi:uncharacterized RDD family membrane protein YckC